MRGTRSKVRVNQKWLLYRSTSCAIQLRYRHFPTGRSILSFAFSMSTHRRTKRGQCITPFFLFFFDRLSTTSRAVACQKRDRLLLVRSHWARQKNGRGPTTRDCRLLLFSLNPERERDIGMARAYIFRLHFPPLQRTAKHFGNFGLQATAPLQEGMRRKGGRGHRICFMVVLHSFRQAANGSGRSAPRPTRDGRPSILSLAQPQAKTRSRTMTRACISRLHSAARIGNSASASRAIKSTHADCHVPTAVAGFVPSLVRFV